MKNNRLTVHEVNQLREACERIRELASLENARFSSITANDEEIKRSIQPYMGWFTLVAEGVERILDGKSAEDFYFR